MGDDPRRHLATPVKPGPPPDAGLAQIDAEFRARAGIASRSGQVQPPSDTERMLSLPLVPADAVWPLRLDPQVLTAAGTIDPIEWRPGTGYCWHITEATISLGAGATQVQIFNEGPQTERLFFSTTASGLLEPRLKLVMPGERLIVVSTGGGCTIRIEGVTVALYFLATYLA